MSYTNTAETHSDMYNIASLVEKDSNYGNALQMFIGNNMKTRNRVRTILNNIKDVLYNRYI